MAKEGMKKTVAKASDTALLEAEALGERVEVVVLEHPYMVNPKAAQAGSALREMQKDNNIWPMYELLLPDPKDREQFEAALPQDPEVGWLMDDFVEAFGSLFEQVAGKKA